MGVEVRAMRGCGLSDRIYIFCGLYVDADYQGVWAVCAKIRYRYYASSVMNCFQVPIVSTILTQYMTNVMSVGIL